MGDRVQELLFSALNGLEKSIVKAAQLREDDKKKIAELIEVNAALGAELRKFKEANRVLAEEVKALSSKKSLFDQGQSDALVDGAVSHDVDLTINQLKSMLTRKN